MRLSRKLPTRKWSSPTCEWSLMPSFKVIPAAAILFILLWIPYFSVITAIAMFVYKLCHVLRSGQPYLIWDPWQSLTQCYVRRHVTWAELCLPQIQMLKSWVPQNVTVFRNGALQISRYYGPQNQYDWCPYRKGKFGERDTSIGKKPCEHKTEIRNARS